MNGTVGFTSVVVVKVCIEQPSLDAYVYSVNGPGPIEDVMVPRVVLPSSLCVPDVPYSPITANFLDSDVIVMHASVLGVHVHVQG